MDGFDIKYPILGYFFGFIGSFPGEIFIALLLGFIGAFGGWLFERLIKYLDNRIKDYIEKIKDKQSNKQDMENVQQFFANVLAKWMALGAIVTAAVATGFINFPEWLILIFSEQTATLLGNFFDAVVGGVGAFIALYQAVRGYFLGNQPEGQIKARSAEDLKAISRSPFKI